MMLPGLRIGFGHDVHALHEGAPLVLGGVLIEGAEAGFRTHSDGDVLSHALIDALAGAMADGDLGTHFPEDDPDAEDARSLNFVREFGERVRKNGYVIVNIDSFVTLGTTRLRPHVQMMRERLADALSLSESCVSVKARSADGLGLEGRGEAASASVVVLISGPESVS